MTPRDPEAPRAAFRVLDALRGFGIPYQRADSYAGSIHGVPRQAHDVDLVVDLSPGREVDIVRALESEFYVDEGSIVRAVAERSTLNVVHLATGIKGDLFVKGPSAFDDSESQPRVVVRLGTGQDAIRPQAIEYAGAVRVGLAKGGSQSEEARGLVRRGDDRVP